MRRLPILLLALLVMLSACDVIGADTAATAEGKDITVDQVTQLADAISRAQGKPESGALLDGATARNALGAWIQVTLAGVELAKRHGSVESTDRQQVTQQLASLKGLPSSTKSSLSEGLAQLNALGRIIGSDTKSPEIKALAREVYDQTPAAQRQQICSEALAGPATGADAVQKLLDAGTPLTDPSAFTDLQFQSIGSNGTYCANPAALPTELQDLYAKAPKGVLQRGEFTSQQSDGSSQSGVLFFKVTGSKLLTPDDPAILQQVEQQVQQQPQLVLTHVFDNDDVHVDPRFGTGFNARAGVLPPTAPITPPSASKTLKLPAASASTSTATPNG